MSPNRLREIVQHILLANGRQSSIKNYVLLVSRTALKVCPSGSMRFAEKCHKGRGDLREAQMDARERCVTMGGDLLTVLSMAEQMFVSRFIEKQLVPGNYWLGRWK